MWIIDIILVICSEHIGINSKYPLNHVLRTVLKIQSFLFSRPGNTFITFHEGRFYLETMFGIKLFKNTIYEIRRFWEMYITYVICILEILIRYNSLRFICVENLFKFCICNFYYSTQAFTTQALHILQESIVKAYQSRFRNQMTIFLSRSEPSKQ